MADFINTIDLLGDDVVVDSIIKRTITKFDDDKVISIGSCAFYKCLELTEVNCPNIGTIGAWSASVGADAFNGCTALKSVRLPSLGTISSATTRIFSGCTSLEYVDLSSLMSVGSGTFYGCTSLKVIDLPKAKSMGGQTFGNCTALTAIILRSETIATIVTTTFTGSSIESGSGYVYVPRALVDGYKAATNWSVYASQIRAIEDYPEITGG